MSTGVLLKGERQMKCSTEIRKGYLNGKTDQNKTNTFWKKSVPVFSGLHLKLFQATKIKCRAVSMRFI